MDTSEIIQQLRDLQIEQNKLFQELNQITNQPKPETTAQATASPADRGKVPPTSEDLKIGDTIVLLTNGIRCKKGYSQSGTHHRQCCTLHGHQERTFNVQES